MQYNCHYLPFPCNKYHQIVLLTPTCKQKPIRVYQKQHHHNGSNNHNFYTKNYSSSPPSPKHHSNPFNPTRHMFNIPRAHGDITVVVIGLGEMIPVFPKADSEKPCGYDCLTKLRHDVSQDLCGVNHDHLFFENNRSGHNLLL